MDTTTEETTTLLLREIEGLRRYVQSRMWGFPGEVDNVLQEARISVWKCASRFDPSRGDAAAFAFGIVSNVVTHEVGRLLRAPMTVELTVAEGMSSVSPDALNGLIEEEESTRWFLPVADAANESEWAAMIELARLDGDHVAAAQALGMTVRTFRATRDRMRILVRTARVAFEVLDGGGTPAPEACIPDESGLREILPHLDESPAAASKALGVVEGVFRTRRALARRAVALVHDIRTHAK